MGWGRGGFLCNFGGLNVEEEVSTYEVHMYALSIEPRTTHHLTLTPSDMVAAGMIRSTFIRSPSVATTTIGSAAPRRAAQAVSTSAPPVVVCFYSPGMVWKSSSPSASSSSVALAASSSSSSGLSPYRNYRYFNGLKLRMASLLRPALSSSSSASFIRSSSSSSGGGGDKSNGQSSTSADGEQHPPPPTSQEIVLTPGEKVVVGTRLFFWSAAFAFASVCGYYIIRELMPTKMSPNAVFDGATDLSCVITRR